jgi:hypothetical protein
MQPDSHTPEVFSFTKSIRRANRFANERPSMFSIFTANGDDAYRSD